MSKHDEVRKTVSHAYGKAVTRPSQESCCGGGDQKGAAAKLAGYTTEELNALPPEAVVNSDQGNTGAEGEPEPEYAETPQQTYSGEAEARAWLEGMVGQNPDIALGECAVDGQTVTCPVNYVDDGLRAIGVEILPGVMVLEVSEEGKITSYSFTPTAEGVAEVQAAAGEAEVEAAAGEAEVEAAAGEAAQPASETPDAIPAMGQGPTLESTVATTAVLLLVVGLLLAAWVGLWHLRRHG